MTTLFIIKCFIAHHYIVLLRSPNQNPPLAKMLNDLLTNFRGTQVFLIGTKSNFSSKWTIAVLLSINANLDAEIGIKLT